MYEKPRVVRKKLKVSNERVLNVGEEYKRILQELSEFTDFDLCGGISLKFNGLSDLEEKIDKLKKVFYGKSWLFDDIPVKFSYIDPEEMRYIVELMFLASKGNIRVDTNYNLKKMLLIFDESSDDDIMLKIFDKGLTDVLEKYYDWDINFYEKKGDFHVSIDKPCYTHLYFRKKSKYSFIRVNKHFLVGFNGKIHFAIDFGKIGDRIYTQPDLDLLLLTHSHIDHVGSFMAIENRLLKPVIMTNLPTAELIITKTPDFPVRPDLKEVVSKAYVNDTMFFGDLKVKSFLSGHAYGVMFYVEDYNMGYSMLYTSDMNLSSKAFKIKAVDRLKRLNPDILAVEFPLFSRFHTKFPREGVIGTTSGEYEELLARIRKDAKIMIDKESKIIDYDIIRRKYKSYLKSKAMRNDIDVGNIDEFFENDYDYFITTKGNARKYAHEKGIQVFVTNTPNTDERVHNLQIKTHSFTRETVDFIIEINPKILIIHHYNSNVRRVSRMISRINNESDVKEIYTTPTADDFLELFKKL